MVNRQVVIHTPGRRSRRGGNDRFFPILKLRPSGLLNSKRYSLNTGHFWLGITAWESSCSTTK
jgi:hypothetical protein